jgi:hypothetical protein
MDERQKRNISRLAPDLLRLKGRNGAWITPPPASGKLTTRRMKMIHWINSYRGNDGAKIVLWQLDHYKYEIEDRTNGKIIARPTSFEEAISFCANFRREHGYSN